MSIFEKNFLYAFQIGTISFFASFVLLCTLCFFLVLLGLYCTYSTIERTSILSSTLWGCHARPRIESGTWRYSTPQKIPIFFWIYSVPVYGGI